MTDLDNDAPKPLNSKQTHLVKLLEKSLLPPNTNTRSSTLSFSYDLAQDLEGYASLQRGQFPQLFLLKNTLPSQQEQVSTTSLNLEDTLEKYRTHKLQNNSSYSNSPFRSSSYVQFFSRSQLQRFRQNYPKLSQNTQKHIYSILEDPKTPIAKISQLIKATAGLNLTELRKITNTHSALSHKGKFYQVAQHNRVLAFIFEIYPPILTLFLYFLGIFVSLFIIYMSFEQIIVRLYYEKGLKEIEVFQFAQAQQLFRRGSSWLPLDDYYLAYAQAFEKKYLYSKANEFYEEALFIYNKTHKWLPKWLNEQRISVAYIEYLIRTAQFSQADEALVTSVLTENSYETYSLLQATNYLAWGKSTGDTQIVLQAIDVLSNLYFLHPNPMYLQSLIQAYILLDQEERVQQIKYILDTIHPEFQDLETFLVYVDYMFSKYFHDNLLKFVSLDNKHIIEQTQASLLPEFIIDLQKELSLLLKENPSNLQIYYALFHYLMYFQKDTERLLLVKHALDVAQKTPILTEKEKEIELFFLHVLGTEFYKTGKKDLAGQYFRYVGKNILFSLNKDYTPLKSASSSGDVSLYNYAFYHYLQEDWNTAALLLEDLPTSNPLYKHTLYYKAVIAYRSDKYKDALLFLTQLQESVKIKTSFSYLYTMGNSLYYLKNYAISKSYYLLTKQHLLQQIEHVSPLYNAQTFSPAEFMWIWRLIKIYNNLGVLLLQSVNLNSAHPDYQEGMHYLLLSTQWYQRLLETSAQYSFIRIQESNDYNSSYIFSWKNEQSFQVYDLAELNFAYALSADAENLNIYAEIDPIIRFNF